MSTETSVLPMARVITKEGVVTDIIGSRVRVRVLRASACGGCTLSGHCNAAECRTNILTVTAKSTDGLSVGDHVRISTSVSAIQLALWVGFGLPLVVLVGLFATARYGLGLADYLSAGIGLLSLIPYYIIVYLCRHWLGQRVHFNIESTKHE
mgnify:CR=1 FL=1